MDRPNVPSALLQRLAIAPDLPRLAHTAAAGKQFVELWFELDGAFEKSAWTYNFEDVYAGIKAGTLSWINRLRSNYRRASKRLALLLCNPMPKRAEDRLKLIDTLLRARKLRERIANEDRFCTSALGALWLGLRTDFDALVKGLSWTMHVADSPLRPSLTQLATFRGNTEKLISVFETSAQTFLQEHHQIFQALDLDIEVAFQADAVDDVKVAAVAERTLLWVNEFERIEEWIDLARADRIVRDEDAAPIADALATGELEPDRAVGELLYARAEALWKIAINRDPALAEISGDDRSRLVSEFCRREEAQRTVVADEIRTRHRSGIPRSGAELSVILGEIAKQRRHLPIRSLVQRTAKSLQAIKPVFLMSPISVSQFLAPGAISFDLLVIDEASQVRPEDALGLIGRVKQMVVVGDKKQLPPTSFFDRVIDEIDDEDSDDETVDMPLAGAARATELESILSACEARGMPGRMLRWHYRSRHPSLIDVSNDEFYDNRLFLPPSPYIARENVGFIHRRVQGAYDRGGKRTNEIEARAVVDAVAAHARNDPDLSLGVVTFSISQRDLIEDLLELKRRDDTKLDSFMQTAPREMLFVKNLENVQGDESDAIMISIGYGPRIAGAGLDSMHFGPVSADGGERRLNVLFTRARVRCEVFSSFGSGDIDLARTSKAGPRVLKRFLRYAESGSLDLAAPTGGDYDSPFEEAVANFIGQIGYLADAQVGSSGFKIDLAVKHPSRPGEYILAVECDGAAYHSARWARERDRLRQQVLERHGWTFHRIWSTDWFRNREKAKQRLIEAIETARMKAQP